MFNLFKNNNLDEMQEQKLLHIESRGCWFAFWALLVCMVIQFAVSPESAIERIAGEWIVFMCLAIYLVVACVKAGIWDRRLKANAKTNLCISLLAGVITGIIMSVINYMSYGFVVSAIIVFAFQFILVSVACFAALSFTMSIYKKRLMKMEEAEEE